MMSCVRTIWTTPTLTELGWNEYWARFYREVVEEAGHGGYDMAAESASAKAMELLDRFDQLSFGPVRGYLHSTLRSPRR